MTFIDFLEKLGRKRTILDREETSVYMERYYLLFPQNSRPQWFGFNLLLHHICRSDADGLHDHPWNWGALILKGGYWEETPEGRFWRGAGNLRFRKSTAFHRLELDKEKAGGETWTLFLIGRRQREWGFLGSNGEWIQWQDYLQNKGTKELINHPVHYQGASEETRAILNQLGVSLEGLNGECIETIERYPHIYGGFHLGNAIKYLWRCGQKGDAQANATSTPPKIEHTIVTRLAWQRSDIETKLRLAIQKNTREI